MAAKKKTAKRSSARKAPGIRQSALVVLKRIASSKSARFVFLWLMAYLVLMAHFLSTINENGAYLEIFPKELVLPSLMHAITALFVALVMFWLPQLKLFVGRLVAVVILALLLIGYNDNLQAGIGLVKAFTPGMTESDPEVIVSLVYMVLLVVLSVGVGMVAERLLGRFRRIQPRDAVLGISVLVAYLFVFPAFAIAQMLPTLIQESGVQAPLLTRKPGTEPPAGRPDIYYIVLDRYASTETLKDQFSFDNSKFTDFLKDNDFNVNDDARSNYPYTTSSISSTFNATYTNELVAPFTNNKVQTATLFHNLIRQSSVVKALKSEGYRYYAVGSSYGASNMAPLAERDYMWDHQLTVFGRTKNLRGIEAVEFMKSPFYSLSHVDIPWWPLHSADVMPVDYVRAQLRTLNSIANEDQQGGRFVFTHILVPHEPFFFNADGSLAGRPSSDDLGKPVKEKYKGQIEFINKQMEQIVSTIQKKSGGQAIILLNADEGPYPQILNTTFLNPTSYTESTVDEIATKEDMREWPADWLKMKFGILQAVHIPKATAEELENISSINMFRLILNRYFNYGLDYLPNCQLGISHGKWSGYNFANISDRLNPNAPSECQQYDTLPK